MTPRWLAVYLRRRMKRKQRYIARLDEVTITREGEYAVIETDD